jgi:hypothetical protein
MTAKVILRDPPEDETLTLGELMSKRPAKKFFKVWIVGDTPLIVHAWSEKSKKEMLAKQVKAVKAAKEARNPKQDFVDSLYEMGDGTYGFPVTGIKKAILASAHKDKGIARSAVMGALWLDPVIVRVRPALAGAICDMPLVRIYGGNPEMREDMVRIGVGLSKTANLAYRGQFTSWAIRITGNVNPDVVPGTALGFLLSESGVASGIGEWRNERSGIFGAYHMGTPEEDSAWEAFAQGKGPLPQASSYAQQMKMAAE